MKVVDIAQEIYFDLNSPSDLSLAAISYWLRANVGSLNSLLFSNFTIAQTNYEIVDSDNGDAEIDINAAAILKKMYTIHRYAVIIRSKLSSTDSDDVIEVTHNDTKVRKIDKNQLIRTVSAEKKQEEESLKLLVSAYRSKQFTPEQVIGDDIVAGSYPDNYPYIRSGRTYGYTAY
jgi:hypothetical protein